MEEISISYVIVTMNRRVELLDCLESLANQDYPNKEIVVVDNNSDDDTVEKVRAEFPQVRLIELKENLYATGGRNHGIRAATGDIVIILDDDARLAEADASSKTAQYFKDNPELGCVCYRIINAFSQEDDIKSIPRRDKKLILHEYACTYMCAAGFAIRRHVALEVGLFWQTLGMYAEEVDLGYRVVDKGYDLVFVPSIVVLHRETPTARPSGRWMYFTVRNRCWIALRSLPFPNVIASTVIWWIYLGGTSIRDRQFPFYLKGVYDALRGIPKILSVREPLNKDALSSIKRLSGRYWY